MRCLQSCHQYPRPHSLHLSLLHSEQGAVDVDKLSATCQRLLREARAKVLKDSKEAPKKTGEGTIDPEEPSELAAKSSLVSLRVGLGFELCLSLRDILVFLRMCVSPPSLDLDPATLT